MQIEGTADPFSLDIPFESPFYHRLFTIARPVADSLIGVESFNKLYQQVRTRKHTESFFRTVLDEMNTSVRIADADKERIPQKGPVVVVANHPFGCIEGIVLGALLLEKRADAKVMANYMLGGVAELREHLFLVDPFSSRESRHKNRRPLREAYSHLQNGGMVGVFPAGKVAHYSPQTHTIEEGMWSDTVSRLILGTGASVLPVWFDGANSALFQSVGLLHPRLRTAMLIREFLRMRGKEITMRVGNSIPAEALAKLGADEDIADYLRTRTLMLGGREEATAVAMPRATSVVLPLKRQAHQEDIDNLPARAVLVECGDFVVYDASAEIIPNVLHEIGRLRELSFRCTGEGTGRSIDLDKFDKFYRHIIVWNRANSEVVGAYRLGQSDVILRFLGKSGLYTSTLFDFEDSLIERVQPALELGRSFVRTEYQKAYQPLLLLWKGIAAFVVNNPQYKTLFGPVSIAGTYQPLSQRLMANFLHQHHYLPEQAALVTPRTPFEYPKNSQSELTAHDLSLLIEDIEGAGRGVPVLLKQYLKLGGKVLGFNVDSKFSNALDSLLLVDLTTTNRCVLERYMGKEGAAAFLAYHGITLPSTDAQPKPLERILHGVHHHTAWLGRRGVSA